MLFHFQSCFYKRLAGLCFLREKADILCCRRVLDRRSRVGNQRSAHVIDIHVPRFQQARICRQYDALAGHFLLRLRFDELLGATCGVAANPVQMVFASKLTGSDRTDVAYSMTFPTGTS